MSLIGRSSSKNCTIATKDCFGKKLTFNLMAINVMSSVTQGFCEVEAPETKGKIFNEIQKSFEPSVSDFL